MAETFPVERIDVTPGVAIPGERKEGGIRTKAVEGGRTLCRSVGVDHARGSGHGEVRESLARHSHSFVLHNG